MALGGLLLLLQVGITRAWKERSTLGEGREMEGGTATTPRKSLETRQVRDPAIEEVRRTAKLSSAKNNSDCFSIADPEKYPCQSYHVLISLERMQGWRHMFCLFVKSLKHNVSSAQHLQHLEYPRHSPDHIHGGNTATLSR
jgi:hypothetical protein